MCMTIIFDTREQEQWTFGWYKDIKLERKTLYPGDYTVKGAESRVRVERKKNMSEVSKNLAKKWKPFQKELKALADFEFKYLIIEQPRIMLDIFPEGSGIPEYLHSRIRVSANFLKNRLFRECNANGIEIIWCSDKIEAEEQAVEIFRRFV